MELLELVSTQVAMVGAYLQEEPAAGAMMVLTVTIGYLVYKIFTISTGGSSSKAADADTAITPDSLHSLIETRRSIFPKDYTGETVPDDVIKGMLAAANWAPTHGKTEPWRFVVASGDAISTIQEIKLSHMTELLSDSPDKLEGFVKKHQGKQKDIAKCSHLIAICLKRVPNSKGKLMPEWEEIAAVSSAVQNMHLHLTTHGFKYGGYWSSGGWDSWLECDRMRELFNMKDEGDRILGLFHLGVAGPAASKYRAKRGDIEEKTVWIS